MIPPLPTPVPHWPHLLIEEHAELDQFLGEQLRVQEERVGRAVHQVQRVVGDAFHGVQDVGAVLIPLGVVRICSTGATMNSMG